MDVKKQYDKLLGDLLGVLDAVDQACLHWQEVEAEMDESSSPESAPELPVDTSQPTRSLSLSPFQRVAKAILRNLEVLFGLGDDVLDPPICDSPTSDRPTSDNLAEVIASGREGAELIQRSLLDALRQHQIIPIPAQGKPFNSKTMFAIGREPDATVPPNTVLEEIVRGYQQGDKILREAQVIVSSQ